MEDQNYYPERDLEKPYPSIGEIIGLQNENTPEGAACRRQLELRFKSADEFTKLPLRDQYLWYVRAYTDVVDNGGIHEFLCRLAGDCAPETLEALEAIGAKSASLGLRQAFDLFPGKMPSRDQAERREQIKQICESVPAISDSSAPYLDTAISHRMEENIFELLMDYWRREGDRPR